MVIVAPICEEFIFRGFFLQGLMGFGAIAAVFLTTLLFVAAHGDPVSAPHLIVAGLLFGAIAIVSGGLAGPIAAHGLTNLIGYMGLRSEVGSRLVGSVNTT